MEQIYEKKFWGGSEHDFYSGEGSHNLTITEPYIDATIQFLTSFKTPITVCDLGCGDFNIGNKLVQYTKKYYAVDIVKDLIERNKIKFNFEKLSFYCLDIVKDPLPTGDCVILRQVLQHLSNAEILKILNKLSQFRFLILTEHIPNGDFTPNLDIITSLNIRLKKKSGLVIEVEPFNFKFIERKTFCEIILPKNKGKIVTHLYTLY